MAKELPYFKFEPSEWENGSIQLCNNDEKVLFINLCCMYWTRLGDLPYKLALQKLCGGNATALDSLCEEKIISVIDGMICIDFLNEQLSEFENISEKNRDNALKGWEKRRKNATALPPQSERNAIREEKRREKDVIDWQKLLETFNKATGKKCTVVNEKAKKGFRARLREGYTKEDIVTAMYNIVNDKYHQEHNLKYLTLEFLSRADKLEMWSTQKPKE